MESDAFYHLCKACEDETQKKRFIVKRDDQVLNLKEGEIYVPLVPIENLNGITIILQDERYLGKKDANFSRRKVTFCNSIEIEEIID